MKKSLYAILALALALGLVIPMAGCGTVGDSGLSLAALADYDSPSEVPTEGDNTLTWTGQGATDGELNSVVCDEGLPDGVNPGDPYLLWVFTHKGNEEYVAGETPYLVLGGTGAGTYYPIKSVGNSLHFVTPYYAPDTSTLTAAVHFNTIETGNGNYVLTVSHGCPGGGGEAQATLSVVKFFDGNANGLWDPGEPLLEPPAYDPWYFTIDSTLYSTPFSDIVDVGIHNLAELMPDEPNWVASNITVVGTESYIINSSTEVEVTLEDADIVTVYFGNYCAEPSGGFSPGYWSQVVMSGGKNPVPVGSRRISAELYASFVDYITNVNPVTLVNNDGSPASFSDALTLSQWIGSGLDAVNMAAQLSRHVAAMILNILSGAVDGDAYYVPAAMTVQEIVDAAKALLNANPIIVEAGELRDQAEQLKDWLDELNNGACIVPSEPCPYTFILL
jgi:hypothetical protein